MLQAQAALSAPTDDELVALFAAGDLADALGRGFDLPTHEESIVVEDRLLELHEAGRIDLLSVVEDGLDGLAIHDFFTLQIFYDRAIPRLAADPDRMMRIVETLVARGGDDGMATQPNAALRQWCQAQPNRAQAIIAAARAGEPRAQANLTFALEALGDLPTVLGFVAETYAPLRVSGLTALSRVPDPDSHSREHSLKALQAALGNGGDEAVAAHVIQAAAAIAVQGDPMAALVLETLRRSTGAPGPGVRNRAAHVIWAYPGIISDETLDLLLPVLEDIDPSHGGTLRELDMALGAMLEAGLAERAVDHLAKVVSGAGERPSLAVFKSTLHRLTNGSARTLSYLVCSWLMTGDPTLCNGLHEALRRLDRDDDPLHLDRAHLPTEPQRLVFLCHKILGWFFLQPRIATHALISVLEACDDEVARHVETLLAEILFRNYGGAAKEFEDLPDSHPAKARVAAALAVNAAYIEGLHSVPELKEMRPSEAHRRLVMLEQKELMRSGAKAAEAESVLLQFVHRSTLLHGDRSLTFLRDADGVAHPMEMTLGTHSVMFELPRLELIDPITLQILLRNLRGERPPA